MAVTRRNEERFLDADERKLVAQARHPGLGEMKADDLRKLARHLRERRDKAARAVRTGNRAARGQDHAGHAETGNREKAGLIQAAIARVNKEFARRDEARE
ncbi:hypothetical protein O9Z70_04440 [Devosia sp. YIM 151766]|uniref:hypothetical protein n=1 Tax=Devosia sp. YIM 151766 TaxID=3017325 RepID=UPI00255CCDD3|nr:hypothetical protein [Devosia sp. YIM 151766]WIY53797.1 hypothetical protein O9Z70_04440 [Devosia sp. YIM 151766]